MLRTAPKDQFEDTIIDYQRCQVTRSGNPLDVSALEFKLLATLILADGRVLSRDQLIDAVWGTGTHVTDRAVDNHVTNLRKKVEIDPGQPRHLITVRGIGYLFERC